MQKRSADRSAGPLRWLEAALTGLLPTPTIPAQITKGLSLWLDEKRGSRHSLLVCCAQWLNDAAFLLSSDQSMRAGYNRLFDRHNLSLRKATVSWTGLGLIAEDKHR